jgi:hypothetical protein
VLGINLINRLRFNHYSFASEKIGIEWLAVGLKTKKQQMTGQELPYKYSLQGFFAF